MMTRHYEFWPARLAKTLPIPETTVYDNLEVTTKRYSNKPAIIYYGNEISYQQLYDEVNALAGYLQKHAGVEKGDRVVLYMQNSPQYVIAFYAILRADAVVVPVNPMNIKDEVAFYLQDCDAKVAIAGQELMPNIEPHLNSTPLNQIIVTAYSEYAHKEQDYQIPDVVLAEKQMFQNENVVAWEDALNKKQPRILLNLLQPIYVACLIHQVQLEIRKVVCIRIKRCKQIFLERVCGNKLHRVQFALPHCHFST